MSGHMARSSLRRWRGWLLVVLIAGSAYLARPGGAAAQHWRWGHPKPFAVRVSEIVSTPDGLMAFGPLDVLSSPDGVTWDRLGDVDGFWGVDEAIAFGDRIVAVTHYSVQSSTDGLGWERHLDFSGDRPCSYMASVASDGATLVAVGFSCEESMGAFGVPSAYFSTTGADWHVADLPEVDWSEVAREELQAVTWDGRQFIAAGQSDCKPVLYTSPDGRRWTRRTGVGGSAIAAGGGVAVAAWGEQAWRSLDGQTWSPVTLPAGRSIVEIEYLGDRFVAVTGDGVLTSADGAAWSYQALAADAELSEVAVCGSRVVLGGRTLYWSDDGETWHDWQSQRLTTVTLHDIATNGREVVAVGDRETILVSEDGASWALAFSGGSWPSLRRLAWNSQRWVAVGWNGIVRSDDGRGWNRPATGSGGSFNGVTWGNGLFVAVGSTGLASVVLTSRDGDAWERQELSELWVLYDVAWNGSVFVAVGDDHSGLVVARSTDARTWYTTPSPSRFLPQRIVALGSRLFLLSGGLWSSDDATVWTRLLPDSTISSLSVAGGFVLATTSTKLLVSGDGESWSSRGELRRHIEAATVLGRRVLSVEDNGGIRYSDGVLGGVRPRSLRRVP